MEQITYLLFMKLLDDNQLVRESNANAFGTAVQDPVFKEGKCVISEQPLIACDYERLRWSRFSNANPPEMFETVRNYVFEFIKRLGGDEDDTAFGRYMKNAVFLIRIQWGTFTKNFSRRWRQRVRTDSSERPSTLSI